MNTNRTSFAQGAQAARGVGSVSGGSSNTVASLGGRELGASQGNAFRPRMIPLEELINRGDVLGVATGIENNIKCIIAKSLRNMLFALIEEALPQWRATSGTPFYELTDEINALHRCLCQLRDNWDRPLAELQDEISRWIVKLPAEMWAQIEGVIIADVVEIVAKPIREYISFAEAKRAAVTPQFSLEDLLNASTSGSQQRSRIKQLFVDIFKSAGDPKHPFVERIIIEVCKEFVRIPVVCSIIEEFSFAEIATLSSYLKCLPETLHGNEAEAHISLIANNQIKIFTDALGNLESALTMYLDDELGDKAEGDFYRLENIARSYQRFFEDQQGRIIIKEEDFEGLQRLFAELGRGDEFGALLTQYREKIHSIKEKLELYLASHSKDLKAYIEGYTPKSNRGRDSFLKKLQSIRELFEKLGIDASFLPELD